VTIDSKVTKAVVKVGDGRGFIVEAKRQRLVITAAHCLPHFPPCHGASYLYERTYGNLLGPLKGRKPRVWAECMLADPVAVLAVLANPDNQAHSKEADVYEAFTENRPPLRLGKIPDMWVTTSFGVRVPAEQRTRGWLLTQAGRWAECLVKCRGERLWIENPAAPIKGGMSGSPILNDEGAAIGIVCTGPGVANPRLTHDLPAGLLRKIEAISE